MKDQQHGVIDLGVAGNLQESLKCFDLPTELVVIRHMYDILPMPDQVIKLINKWGSNSDKANYGTMLQFCNRNKAKFDWDNDDIEKDKGLIEDETMDNPHPSLQAKIPGVELE